ncbi:MAG: ribosome small subunit-dependent GTPase A, partial [Candidatus Zixiibacteriota bacterium]
NDLESAYGQIGIPFCAVSALDPATLSGLRSRLKDRRSLFVGHSGVGKTTLLNSLIPGLNLRTAAVSRVTSKGRHTTTRVELREFPDGGYLVDSPGLKILSHWKVDRSNLPEYFREFAQFRGRCRFDDCLHASEPLCAVKEAVEAGIIPTQRYKSYLQIRETL